MSHVNTPSGVSVSFLVISYQQKDYIEEALKSALSQDYQGLQVVVSDDASNDGTWEIIQRIAANYVGPHQIVIRRNENNKGLATNFNEGLKLCTGVLIVVQAGDDISESHRTTELVKIWLNNDCRPDLLYSEISRMSHDGQILSVDKSQPSMPTIEELKGGRHFIAGGMAAAYTKRLFDKYGLLPERTYAEDYVLSYRAILAGGIAHHPAALVRYRMHDKSIMGVTRANADKVAQFKRFAYSSVAEQSDRVISWKISGNSDLLYGIKLNWKLQTCLLAKRFVEGELVGKTASVLQAFLTMRWSLLGNFIKFVVQRKKPQTIN